VRVSTSKNLGYVGVNMERLGQRGDGLYCYLKILAVTDASGYGEMSYGQKLKKSMMQRICVFFGITSNY
jgi:hypothetical protein